MQCCRDAARTRCAFPVASPPAFSSVQVSNPNQSQQNVSPFNHLQLVEAAAPVKGYRAPNNHSQGNFALPAPTDSGDVPAPKNPDNSIKTISSRHFQRNHIMGANHAPFGCCQSFVIRWYLKTQYRILEHNNNW